MYVAILGDKVRFPFITTLPRSLAARRADQAELGALDQVDAPLTCVLQWISSRSSCRDRLRVPGKVSPHEHTIYHLHRVALSREKASTVSLKFGAALESFSRSSSSVNGGDLKTEAHSSRTPSR